MPTYEYICQSNGRKVDVRHGMSEVLKTWGELCAAAGIDPGKTPKSAKVEKAISGGYVLTKGKGGSGSSGGPPAGGCAHAGGCHCH